MRRGGRSLGLILMTAAAVLGEGAWARPVAGPSLAMTLSPALGTSGQISTVAVTLRFTGLTAKPNEALLRLPLVVSNVDTVATAMTGLSASDEQGALVLKPRDVDLPVANARDAVSGGPSREWLVDRAVRGAVTVRYTVPANATLPPRGAAPPFAFTNDGSGTSAAGHVFVLLPPQPDRYHATIDWDLRGLPKGARGISSLGEGRVNAQLTGAQLRTAFYMAGAVGTWPRQLPPTGFFSAWQGKPPFDTPELMRWTGTLYGRYATLFGQKTPPPYGVFLRYNPINAGGGVGLYHSFVATFGKADGRGSDPDKLRFTLAHEMFHTFQSFLHSPAGLESSWFGEGLATFYQSALPLRFGLIGPDAFLDDINSTARRYYSSAMANVPNAEVPRRFWADTRVRTLPYDRGMLYFATVDDAVRKASGGKKSLDDLMLAMLELEKSGRDTSLPDWEALVGREIGARGVSDVRDVLAGTVIPLPASDAFGPCFRRVTAQARRYELGFDPAVLAEPRRIVRGLLPGSAAAAAGLRNGDEIVIPVPQDGIQGDQKAMLDLIIQRGSDRITISYLPRGETVSVYQWERVPGVGDAACKR